MSGTQNPLTFSCPRCQVVLRVDPAREGESFTCTNCQAPLVVPGAKTPAGDAFSDLFDLEESAGQLPQDLMEEIDELPAPPTADNAPAPQGEFELLPLEPPDPRRAPPPEHEDPYAVDDDAPIRLEGIGPVDPHERMIHVRCPVCDSMMLVGANQAGSRVQCTDCHSMVTVEGEMIEPVAKKCTAPPRDTAEEWTTRELTPFPELEPGMEQPPPAEPGGYVLQPLTEDHLRPRATLDADLLEESAAQGSSATAAQERPRSRAVDSPTAIHLPPPGPTSTATPAEPRRSEYEDRPRDCVDAYEKELRATQDTDGPVDETQLFRFPDQFLAPFRDPMVWAYVLILTLMIWLNSGLFSLAAYLSSVDENGVQVYSAIGLLLFIFACGFTLFVTFVGAVVVNQLVEAAAYKRNVFHPPEIGIFSWITSFAPVGVSIWAASLVGGLIGRLLTAMTNQDWLGWIVTALLVFALLPIGILSAYYNGSPIKIVSPVVLSTMRTHRAGWLRFYRWMAVWLALSILVTPLAFLPIIGGVLIAFARAATIILVGRTIGLLAQAFIANWIDS